MPRKHCHRRRRLKSFLCPGACPCTGKNHPHLNGQPGRLHPGRGYRLYMNCRENNRHNYRAPAHCCKHHNGYHRRIWILSCMNRICHLFLSLSIPDNFHNDRHLPYYQLYYKYRIGVLIRFLSKHYSYRNVSLFRHLIIHLQYHNGLSQLNYKCNSLCRIVFLYRFRIKHCSFHNGLPYHFLTVDYKTRSDLPLPYSINRYNFRNGFHFRYYVIRYIHRTGHHHRHCCLLSWLPYPA